MRPAETDSAQTLVERLTRREGQMLVLLAEGYSRPEIATKLTLGLTSVKFHIQHLYGKLGVNSKRQALSRAMELGLLEAPPPAALAGAEPGPSARHNMPMQVTRFFGREDEIAQLRDRLDEYRLVTLTGSGGVGKTRLSMRVAEEALTEFADGVWFVTLASLSEPELAPRQAAASLGLRDEPGRSSQETLTRFLRQRQVLLLLDNCEHLRAACARLADTLLRACPFLKILASSREPLGVSGEAIFRVPSLPFPDPGRALAPERLSDFPSVRLFLDRVRLVVPNYRIAAHNAAAIASICQRLDGIPLALELAAARVKLLTARQVADRLDDSLGLLTGGSLIALPRHQTLQATIEWSYNLLGEPERLLLRRLSIFAGGCTLAAAEAVCAGEGLTSKQMLDGLTAMVDKSLVIAERRTNQDTRYRLLEMVRQFAAEKLAAAGEHVDAHRRHRDYFVVFVETNGLRRYSSDKPILIRKIRDELENVRLALAWSFNDMTELEAGPRLVVLMHELWFSHQEHFDWCLTAVAWCDSHTGISPRLYAALLGTTSRFAGLNDPQGALAWAKKAVEMGRRLGPEEHETLIRNLCYLGAACGAVDDHAGALAAYTEAEAIFLDLGPAQFPPEQYAWHLGFYSLVKADLANAQGRYADAKSYASESIRHYQAIGDRWWSLDPRIAIGTACLNLGEPAQARDHFQQALELISENADLQGFAQVQRGLGLADLQENKLEHALGYFKASVRQAAEIPDYNLIASCLGLSARVAARQDQPRRAATSSGASRAMYVRQGRKPWEDTSLDTLMSGWRADCDLAGISAAYAAGQAMTSDEAIAFALSESEA